MAFHLKRGMVSEAGTGWAVTDPDGKPKPGRWATEEEARENGLCGVYLLSGDDVVFVECPAEVKG